MNGGNLRNTGPTSVLPAITAKAEMPTSYRGHLRPLPLTNPSFPLRTSIPSSAPRYSVERTCFRFHKMLAEFVWDASMLEGNPLTFPEVQTLLSGITVGGRKISDQRQVLNFAEASRRLLAMVKGGDFELSKDVCCELNAIVAYKESPKAGALRGD